MLLGLGSAAALAGGSYALLRNPPDDGAGVPAQLPTVIRMAGSMPFRRFGSTGLQVSEVGFGAWAIGGNSYGSVQREESLAALARAEELGCNFVDTAAVYGDSEGVLGEFLAGRRARWVVSTKFSGQSVGMTATLESQLRALRTDYVDFYMIHWVPGAGDKLFAELQALKKAGKARFVGVSLYSAGEIDRVIGDPALDGFMLAVSLLDPDPFLGRRAAIAASGKAVIARSSLKEGFLAGKFTHASRFTDPADQRSKWSVQQIERTVDQVEQFRFLEARAGSLAGAAIGYPLSFPEVSSVVVGVKKVWEADANFGRVPGYRLNPAEMAKVAALQQSLGLRTPGSWLARLRSWL